MRYTIMLLLVLFGSQASAQAESPVYVCHFSEGPIKIDGQLNEPAWQQAQVVNLRYPFRPKVVSHLPETNARLLWDENSLYIGWEAKDVDIWSYSDKKDDVLWKGDIVEFFVRPSKTNRLFYEINVAPNGTIYDALYPSRGAGSYQRFKKWDSQVRVATHIDGTDDQWRDKDQGFTAELAIPLAAFVESGLPKAGAVWDFGLFRCDYSNPREEPLLFSSLPGELDPTHGFHSYELYQPMIFEGKSPTRK